MTIAEEFLELAKVSRDRADELEGEQRYFLFKDWVLNDTRAEVAALRADADTSERGAAMWTEYQERLKTCLEGSAAHARRMAKGGN